MAEPQRGRSELDAYAVALLGDNPTDPIEPDALRRVLKADRYAATNLADDGAPGAASGGGAPYVLPGPNLRRDGIKLVKWRTVAEAEAEGYGNGSLEGLPSEGLYLNGEAVVENYNVPGQPGRQRVRLALRYDNDPDSYPEALRTVAYEDGNSRGQANVPGVWLEVGTMQEAANVRRYNVGITNWQADETTKILFAGDTSDSFFTVLQAGGPFPSPVKGQTDAYYRPAAAPQPVVAFARNISLDDASGSDGIAARKAATAGVTYFIRGDWQPDFATVAVEGLSDGSFASSGLLQLADGGSQQVVVDVEMGLYSVDSLNALRSAFYGLRADGLRGYDSLAAAVMGGESTVQFQRASYTPTEAVGAADLNITSTGCGYQNDAATRLYTDGGYLNIYTTNIGHLGLQDGNIEVHNGIVSTLEMVGAGFSASLFNAPVNTIIGNAGTIIVYPGTPNLPAVPSGVIVVDKRGGASGTEEVQISSDSTYRVARIKLSKPRTFLDAKYYPSQNTSALTFQVNAYRNNAWVAGMARTMVADLQADINALTAADYTNGAEVEIQLTPVTASANAGALLHLQAAESISFLSANRAARRGGTAFTSYSIQETDARVRNSGNFTGFASDVAYGGTLLYNTSTGSWCEVTVPASCTRVVFEGYKDGASSANAGATVNGNLVGTGSMNSGSSAMVRGTYFDFMGVTEGDVLRLTNNTNNGLLIDQVTFY